MRTVAWGWALVMLSACGGSTIAVFDVVAPDAGPNASSDPPETGTPATDAGDGEAASDPPDVAISLVDPPVDAASIDVASDSAPAPGDARTSTEAGTYDAALSADAGSDAALPTAFYPVPSNWTCAPSGVCAPTDGSTSCVQNSVTQCSRVSSQDAICQSTHGSLAIALTCLNETMSGGYIPYFSAEPDGGGGIYCGLASSFCSASTPGL